MKLSAHNGSVQSVNLPSDLRSLYKTGWEIEKRSILDMAADRGVYIDQTPSLNIHVVIAATVKISSRRFRGWQLGLKKGMYYLRTKAAADAIKFTVDVDKVRRAGSDLSRAADGQAGSAEQRAIEQLRAGEPKQACLKPARRHAKARQGRQKLAGTACVRAGDPLLPPPLEREGSQVRHGRAGWRRIVRQGSRGHGARGPALAPNVGGRGRSYPGVGSPWRWSQGGSPDRWPQGGSPGSVATEWFAGSVATEWLASSQWSWSGAPGPLPEGE